MAYEHAPGEVLVAAQFAGACTVQAAVVEADEPLPPPTVRVQLVKPTVVLGSVIEPVAPSMDCDSGCAPVHTKESEFAVALVEVQDKLAEESPWTMNALLTVAVRVGMGEQLEDTTCQEPLLQARLAVPLWVVEFQLLRVTRPPPPVKGST